MQRIDDRTENYSEPQWESPYISLGRDSVFGLATYQFLLRLDMLVQVHLANTQRKLNDDFLDGDAEFISNMGRYFINDIFRLHSYDWSDDYDSEEDDGPSPNSDCFLDHESGAAVSWYKYAPRGMCVNDAFLQALEDDTIGEVLMRCHKSLDA